MFGHSDDNKDDHQPIDDLLSEPALDGVLNDDRHDEFNPALPPADNQPGSTTAPSDTPSVDEPVDTDAKADEDTSEPEAPAVIEAPKEEEAPAPRPAAFAGDDDLLKIKQSALDQLSPLVDQLEQSPEEKFHTMMMMIQANDNQDLVKPAYEAAQAITDEKVRAKALLDIVNEINYFTQNPSS